MAFYTHINVPFSVTGGLSSGQNGGGSRSSTLSGFTCALTQFKFQITPGSTYYHKYPYLSNDTFVWDMGDGTRVKGASAFHIYQYPGVYTVSLLAYTSGGQEYLSTITREVSVGNFLNDKLTLQTDDIINVINVPAGTKRTRIKLNRENSWQPHQALSAIGYTINLHASGSLCRPLTIHTYNTFKWAHLDERWAFYQPLTANDGTLIYDPVDKIQTVDNEDIYILEKTIKGAQTFTRVGSSFLASSSGVSAVFVGTSGAAEFLYVDDKPKLTEDPVFIYGHLDTSKFPNHKHILNRYPSIETPFKYFEHYGITIPVRVRFNPAKDIQFTSSGIRSMPISKIKYQLTDIPLFIGLGDSYDNVSKNYPSLNMLPTSGDTIESSSSYVVNLSTLSGSDNDFTEVTHLSTHYYKPLSNQLPATLNGTFFGHFIPIEASENVKLIANTTVDDVPNFSKDIHFGYISNDDHCNEKRLLFESKYGFNNETGIHTTTKSILTHNVNYDTPLGSNPAETVHAPVGVIHVSDDLYNNRVNAYMTYTESALLTSFNTYNAKDKIFDIDTVFITDVGVKKVSDAYYKTGTGPGGHVWANGNAKTTVTDISIDENRHLFLAMPELSIVMSISGNKTDKTICNDIWINKSQNMTYHTATTGNSRLAVTKGIDIVTDTGGVNNTHHPSRVEAGKHNTVWIAYTNPISGELRLYGNSETLSATYDFDQPLAISDMSVDNKGNCWAAVTNKFRHLYGYPREGETNDYQRSLSARDGGKTGSLAIAGVGTKSDNQFNYVFSTTSFTISAGELLEVIGFHVSKPKSYYDGTFLVQSASANPTKTSVTVNPYIGRYNQASTTTGSETVSAFKRPSDRLYKFNAHGTKLFTVSGIYDPIYTVVDHNQNLWISHDVDTVTQFNTAGTVINELNVQSSSFTDNFVSAGSNLTEAHVQLSQVCPLSTVQHHIGGLSLDTYGNLLVINGFENKIFSIPTSSISLSSNYAIGSDMHPSSADHGFTYGRSSARGDWTGFTWLNKYKNSSGTRSVTGETTFSVYASGGKYKIRKLNENFDPQETIKSYRFTPNLLNYDTLFDDLIGTIVGTVSSDSDALGRVIYEKIANFVDNISDPETCNVDSLYSLFDQLDININNYNLQYPGKLKRIVDLVSIPHHKLWGGLEKYDRDVHLVEEGANFRLANLGSPLSADTYIVTADQPIVGKHLFGSHYVKIDTGYVAPYALSGLGSSQKIDDKLDIVGFNVHVVEIPGSTVNIRFKIQFSDDGETWSDITFSSGDGLSLSEANIKVRNVSVPVPTVNEHAMTWNSKGPRRYWRLARVTAAGTSDIYFADIEIKLNGDSDYTSNPLVVHGGNTKWTSSPSVLNFRPTRISEPSATDKIQGMTDNANLRNTLPGDFIQLDAGYWQNPNYMSKYDVLSSYPLSGYTPSWGWGLGYNLSGTDVFKHVKFYEYKAQFTDYQLEGVIDWSNPQTTLSRSLSTVTEWTEQYGIIDNLIDVELRKGLHLFNDSVSAYTPGVL